MIENSEKLVEVKDLKKYFSISSDHYLKAVDNVSFEIYKGETFGLVGESGCGKSTTGRTMIGLYDVTEGEVLFDGVNVHRNMTKAESQKVKRKMQMIFQDPYASLNPRMTVMDIIAEGLDVHRLVKNKAERKAKVNELLEIVGLNEDHSSRYPHEFSGGQRQRIGIARALAVEPEFIIADEPISALDVSVQAQVVNLMRKLQKERGLTYLFIAHDLSMVKFISDRVGVMYLGNLVELAESNELYTRPLHPYTQALLSSIPPPDPRLARSKERILLQGEIPSPVDPPNGCRFNTRCPQVMEKCKTDTPTWVEDSPGHWIACHLYNKEEKAKI